MLYKVNCNVKLIKPKAQASSVIIKAMHHWQDIVLSIGSLVLALALVPSVFSKAKPALWTCALTSAALIAFIVAYASLSLWYTTVTTSIAALLWLTLLIQNLIKD